MTVPVILEVGAKRSFASALEWPGWSRSGRTPEEAIERLVEYAPRYARVARRAKLRFRVPGSVADIEVAQRVRGDGGTDFGVPGKPAKAESEPMTATDVERAAAILRASWAAFDAATRAAEGVRLAVGPRGGGRSRSKVIEHVREAEVAYLWKLGGRAPSAADEPPTQPMKRLRAAVVETLTAV